MAGTFHCIHTAYLIVSAYGNVELGLVYTGKSYNLTGGCKILSQVVISAIMMRGRHRRLPHALDQTIVLPEQPLSWEDEDKKISVPSGYRMKKYNTP